MRPYEFYQKTAKNSSVNKKLQSLQFFNGTVPLYNLRGVSSNDIPSDIEIYKMQVLIAKSTLTPMDKSLSEWYNKLNGSKLTNIKNSELSYNEVINIIETIFQKNVNNIKGAGHVEELAAGVAKKDLDQYNFYLRQITRLIMIIDSRQDGAFVSTQELQKLHDELTTAKKTLEAGIASATKGKNNARRGKNDLETLQNIGKQLKGRLAEVTTNDFFNEILPKDLVILDTANVYIDGKKSVIDTALIDKSMQLSCKIGGKQFKGTMNEFFAMIEKKQNKTAKIEFSNNEWDELLNNTSFGIQVKSGLNAMTQPFNKDDANTSLSIMDVVLKTNVRYATYLAQFVSWYQKSKEVGKGTSRVYASSASSDEAEGAGKYEAYFNYCASKQLARVFGKGNNIFVLRGQIYTIDRYLEEIWSNGRKYLRASRPIDLSKPTEPIPMSIRSSNATYGYSKE